MLLACRTLYRSKNSLSVAVSLKKLTHLPPTALTVKSSSTRDRNLWDPLPIYAEVLVGLILCRYLFSHRCYEFLCAVALPFSQNAPAQQSIPFTVLCWLIMSTWHKQYLSSKRDLSWGNISFILACRLVCMTFFFVLLIIVVGCATSGQMSWVE